MPHAATPMARAFTDVATVRLGIEGHSVLATSSAVKRRSGESGCRQPTNRLTLLAPMAHTGTSLDFLKAIVSIAIFALRPSS
jgi:hypothetical protein